MSVLPHVLFLFIFSSIFVLRLQADDANGHDNVGIIGGHIVSITDAPYIVALYQNDDGFCGGSIIHERFILTAAHCVVGLDSNDTLQILVGSDQLTTGGVLIDVEAQLCHEGYEFTEHDICLLKLTEPVQFGCKAALVDLPDEDSQFEEDGLLVNITGWGNINIHGVTYPNHLRQTMVPLVSNERCKEIYPDLTENMLCAGTQGRDSCQGDSGGPLTYDNVQIGVVSYGDGCAVVAGVYTRVSKYLDWINNTITENL